MVPNMKKFKLQATVQSCKFKRFWLKLELLNYSLSLYLFCMNHSNK